MVGRGFTHPVNLDPQEAIVSLRLCASARDSPAVYTLNSGGSMILEILMGEERVL